MFFTKVILSLSGYSLWSLSSPDLDIIQFAVNYLLRRIWKLPRNTHCNLSFSSSSYKKFALQASLFPILLCYVIFLSSGSSSFLPFTFSLVTISFLDLEIMIFIYNILKSFGLNSPIIPDLFHVIDYYTTVFVLEV